MLKLTRFSEKNMGIKLSPYNSIVSFERVLN